MNSVLLNDLKNKWPWCLLLLALSPQLHAVEGVARPEMKIRLEQFRNDPSQVLGMEIWEVAGNRGDLNSAFGHVLFRFIDGDSDDRNDLVLNYYPVMDSENGNPILSLFSHYDLGLEINTLEHFMSVYLLERKRAMRRIVVLSNEQMRKDFVESTFENFYSQEARGKYAGLGNNCLGAVLRSFEDAGFPQAGPMVFMPADTKKYLKRVGLAPFPAIELDAATDAIPVVNEPQAISYERLPFEAYQICTSLSCASVAYQVIDKLLESNKRKIKSAIKFRPWRDSRRIGPPHRSTGIGARSSQRRIQWNGLKDQIAAYYEFLKREFESRHP